MTGPPLEPVGFILQRSQNGATFTLAHPENLDALKDLNRNFPSAKARTLAEILKYHGAAACYWRPE